MMNFNSKSKIDNQERGIRRVADLSSIDSQGLNANIHEEMKNVGYIMHSSGNTKIIEIFDIWKTIKVKFTVLHTKLNQDESIRITGNIPELGNWNKVNPVALT
jgi:hypothetical protein